MACGPLVRALVRLVHACAARRHSAQWMHAFQNRPCRYHRSVCPLGRSSPWGTHLHALALLQGLDRNNSHGYMVTTPLLMLFLPAAAFAALVPPPLQSRRTVLAAAAAAAAATLPTVRSSAVDGGFGAFVAQRNDEAAAEATAKLTDPFASARANDPGRQAFADEAPPLDAAERQQRASEASRAASGARPAPRVSPTPAPAAGPVAAPGDEFTLEFTPDQPLGLRLRDLRVGTQYGTREGTSRVVVSDVIPGGQAAASGRVEIDNLVVAVDGANVEREAAKSVQARLAAARAAGRPTAVTFKDALAFNSRLSADPTRRGAEAMEPVATTIAPATPDAPAQVLAIRRVEVPERCTRNAAAGDLLEIRYTGRLADGTVFDGMQLADRLMDDSIQFVLGRQPAGQFPPSWDVGLVGMCVGERREIDVPPVLGFGPKGLPKRGVPPNARLLYDVELLAINALSTP